MVGGRRGGEGKYYENGCNGAEGSSDTIAHPQIQRPETVGVLRFHFYFKRSHVSRTARRSVRS